MPARYWLTWLATLLFFAAFYTLLVPLPLYLARVGLPDWQVAVILGGFGSPGLGYAAYGLGIIATRLLTRRLQDRGDRTIILVPALLSLTAGLAGLALAAALAVLLAAALLVAAGSGVLHPALIAAHVERTPSAERGRATALFYLGFDLGIGVGAWVLSPFLHRWVRGRGVGRLAMEALIAAAERAGYWKLVSRIFPNNEASRKLLLSVGFREVGTYRNHARLDGVWRDVVVVERLIDCNLGEGRRS